MKFQALVRSRGYGLGCLPSLPVSAIRELEPTEANQGDPAATLVITSLGLPSRGLEPQIFQPPPLESVTTPEGDTIPESSLTRSPPTEEAKDEVFYLEDGNVEVLCERTLFRVHTTIQSFHSPVLCRVFAQTDLVAAESPNGCPCVRLSDRAKDFTTLLNAVYLPGFVALPTSCWIFC